MRCRQKTSCWSHGVQSRPLWGATLRTLTDADDYAEWRDLPLHLGAVWPAVDASRSSSSVADSSSSRAPAVLPDHKFAARQSRRDDLIKSLSSSLGPMVIDALSVCLSLFMVCFFV
jgi:hypothetical protein